MPTSTPPGSIRRRPRSLAQEVLDSLTEQIRSGVLAPGVKLPSEFELTQVQGVSRTVIREAILRLQASGLVETRKGIGTFVLENVASTVTLESARLPGGRDVFAILELRTCIETEAAGLAALRADARDLENIYQALQSIEARARLGEDASSEDFQFHMQIARATRNLYLVDVLSQLDPRNAPRANLAPERYLSRVNNEHSDIYEAIARGEAEGARAAMRMHLINSRERMRRAATTSRE
ncbi:FadR family transcriptional regulator [Paraburkholderia panacisoli]|uniref:FadR family transcriptional regulator n=1 Tax=Paraburkholderia panacisoli TaxID=2603818 RepID=A0A5B0HE59_9BURK|nr:FadR/GntR family transcriptional regulator [Paraburkholderia panacisoli]KAA1013535.1 FadR family transcriptional regulator [Paraburkholderia panacisoli]